MRIIGQIEVDYEHFQNLLAPPASNENLQALQTVFLAAAVSLLLIALLSIVMRLHNDRRHHGPAYRRMAARLGLSRSEHRLLERAARATGRVHPLTLLISSGSFDRAVTQLRAENRLRQLDAIRGKIYG